MKLIVIVLLICGSALGWRRRCPANRPRVNCIVNPCDFSSCEANPNARCRANYCGGCNAEWYVGRREINCTTGCPNGLPPVNCVVNPCSTASCPGSPNAECRPNYCGRCNAEFFVRDRRVSCDPTPFPCPEDQPQYYCFANPCQLSSCPSHPEATCWANYCGGCTAEWYNRNAERIYC